MFYTIIKLVCESTYGTIQIFFYLILVIVSSLYGVNG